MNSSLVALRISNEMKNCLRTTTNPFAIYSMPLRNYSRKSQCLTRNNSLRTFHLVIQMYLRRTQYLSRR